MSYIVFFLVLSAACLLMHRIPFIKKSGLGARFIILLFVLKVVIGVLQAYITQLYYPGNDTWGLNNLSFYEYDILKNDPARFFRELYISNYSGEGYDNIFGSYGSFWNDLEQNLLSKGLAPFNFISNGNYYINSIVFNFFGFFGHIALYRLFSHIYKNKKITILIGCFLLPTCMFFSSAIGKDNVVFTMLGMFCFALYFFTISGFNTRRVLWLLLFFSGVLLMRNHVAILLIPPAIAFYLSVKTKKNPWFIFGMSLIILIGLLFIVPQLAPSLNTGAILSQKQKDFLDLGIANTQINISPLAPSTTGLVKNFPEAFINGFFRPYIFEAKSAFMTLQALEIILMIVGSLSALYYIIKFRAYKTPEPFVLFCLLFCCMLFLMNGYIVPNSNTLVRYRSIYLPLVIIPVLCNIKVGNNIFK